MSKLKYWPTKKIKEVLEENYNRGSSGIDYEEIVPELKAILYEREERQAEIDLKQYELESDDE